MAWKHGDIPLWHVRQRYNTVAHHVNAQTGVILAGFICGLMVGHMYHQHNQVGSTAVGKGVVTHSRDASSLTAVAAGCSDRALALQRWVAASQQSMSA